MIDYRLLGPIEVGLNGHVLDIGGQKQRALLAVLLLSANEPVSRDVLVDRLWGEHPPAGAQHTLEVYVSRLRKALEPVAGGQVVLTRPGAYVLQTAAERIDVRRFERLAEEGHRALAANAPGRAVSRLSAALQLWRGNALGDLSSEPFAQVEIARLEELRLGAVEDRIESDLALGRHTAVVGELETLVAVHPLRERLHEQLMLALYRSGRQAEALAAYQSARRTLVEELGLEPGPALQRLERAILRQETSLELPGRAVGTPVPEAPRLAGHASRSRKGRRRLVAACLSVAVVAGTGFLLVSGPANTAQARLRSANGLVAISTASGRLVAATRLGGAPGALSGGAGSVWVADPGGAAVARINPVSAAAVDQIPVGGEPGSIVSGGGAIWAASTVGATVTRIDPTTDGVTQTITLPGGNPGAIAYGGGRLWVADSAEDELFEIDPASGSLERALSLDLQPSALAVAEGAIWVAGYNHATVERIDPATGRVTARVHVGDGPAALAFGDGSLWVANSLDSTVSRVNPATLTVKAPIPVGSGPDALAAGAGSEWVANQYSGTVSRIDPSRDQVVASMPVGGAPTSLAVSGSRLWAGVAADSGSHRGRTLVIVTPSELTSSNPMTLDSVDPAFYNIAANPQFTGLAYDALVNFQQSPGTSGDRLVPDLALAIPNATNGGRTYAFRIRPGVRYSDGQPLRASDFRRGIERLFRVHSPGTTYYSELTGAAACIRYPAHCDLSPGIVTDDVTSTVIFHLIAPDPQFLFNLTQFAFSAPVPPGTPDHETGSRTVPSTGPYKIASVSANEIRFVRNPFFREWSHAAQPAGNPDAIVWRTVPTVQDAVSAVEHGRADWVVGLIPRAQYRQLSIQAPAQLHSSPEFTVDFAPLNTNRAPFNNIRVRQALNYAINRREIVRLYGGPSFATITCQVITPGLPGYRRYCPYTQHPRAVGTYTGPDMVRARRLVHQSGTRGEQVDVWGASDNPYVPPAVPRYVAGVLRALGYRVRLHLVPFASITEAMRQRFQLSVDGDWVANYPDPSSYLPQFFGCGGGTSNGYYCNPPLDREMHAASLLELSAPLKATALWESVDRQLTDDAIWVPTVNEREVDFVSKRLRNYEYNPVWGFLADQSWLR
jgi:YVTN family beta-propeller protein